MSEEDKTIHCGWLEFYTESSSGAWSKISGKRQWKRKFVVLNQSASNEEECYLLTFDKEELWRVSTPKKRLALYPRYKVSKLSDFKGRERVLEINNESNQWYLTSSKNRMVNLWALQIQMQTKLSRAISGRIFSVVGIDSKDMQSIGAANQNCLLHFTKWGITLALQRSRAILAMWPLKTIRNYEDSGHSEFTIEAGRRAPMGEGFKQMWVRIGKCLMWLMHLWQHFLTRKPVLLVVENKRQMMKSYEPTTNYTGLQSERIMPNTGQDPLIRTW